MNQPFNEEILSAYLDGELDDAQRTAVEQIIGGNGNGEKQGGPLNGLPSTQESLDNIREYKKTIDGLLDGSFMKEK